MLHPDLIIVAVFLLTSFKERIQDIALMPEDGKLLEVPFLSLMDL